MTHDEEQYPDCTPAEVEHFKHMDALIEAIQYAAAHPDACADTLESMTASNVGIPIVGENETAVVTILNAIRARLMVTLTPYK